MRKTLVGFAALAFTWIAAAPAGAATVTNGNFETGTLAGWTVQDQPTGTDGSWFATSGASTPAGPPPEGTFAAVTSQSGPGSHLLYQDIALEAGFAHQLQMFVYYNNQNGAFFAPDTLDADVVPNQQYRVDVLAANAAPTSVAPSDVLVQVFRTDPGEPAVLGPTQVTVDLTPFAGRTVRLRFAEVDNQFFFNAAVDDVRIVSTPRTPPNKDACKRGGWRNFVDDHGQAFKNQGRCVSFVVSHHR
jgi:hypothetical protein